MHPNIQYSLSNDQEIESFFNNYFIPDYCDMIESFKLGVMRADLWRLGILYIYGGIYSDVDVIPHKHISKWDYYPFNDYRVIIGIETPRDFCNWAI